MAEKKTKRRDPGSGSLYQRASDGKWVGTIEAGYTRGTGTRRRLTVVRSSKSAARDALKEKVAEVQQYGIPEKNSARVTVKHWSEVWLPEQEMRVRPKTFLSYRTAVNRWIVAEIGNVALASLTPAHIRSVHRAAIREGRSTSSARAYIAILMKLLRDAEREGHRITRSVFTVEAPKLAANDRGAIDLAHARDLLAAATQHQDGSRWIAALLQGMRQGECLGLTWDAVNLTDQTIDVSWQLQALPRKERFSRTSELRVPEGYEHRQVDGSLCLVRPKTAQGKRIVPMVPWMTAALTAWRTLCPPSPHGLVWPAADGSARTAREDAAAWVQLQDQAQVACVAVERKQTEGRRYVLHEARHTCATLLLNAGVDPHTVTAILGHSSITTSRGYQTVSTALARQAMDAVQAVLGLPEIEPPHGG